MTFFEELRAGDPSSAVAFHLEGLLDATDRIKTQLSRLDQLFGVELEPAAEVLVELQVELYSHLFHHLKHLRVPLRVLIDGLYQEIPDLDLDESPSPSGEGSSGL